MEGGTPKRARKIPEAPPQPRPPTLNISVKSAEVPRGILVTAPEIFNFLLIPEILLIPRFP